ncbi:YdhR family protein [Herbiconiux ginsengi]|uniref:Putative mono-oxygenase ydhR n=1 Tax=Herbiconiux ginsengi TaxID=381665 RepID=A0A1H3L7V7_9MICO|nr:YdhR family protein [Herbiconiux ginsengi]SDY59975.1 Putative mono-oxygenase ydhR [Herbiconiux ginsengi]
MVKAFLYTEVHASVPFEHLDWKSINPSIKAAPGFIRKTWLSGVGTQTIGGFYEFDTIENALAFAQGPFADEARSNGATSTTKVFDGDVTRDASVDMNSPYFE